MTNFDLMEVLDTCQDLMEEAARFSVLQPAFLDDIVEELATTSVLHD